MHIQGFNIGLIEEANLTLREGLLNFLVAGNAEGKTTLLRAIGAAGAREKVFGITQADASALISKGKDSASILFSTDTGSTSVDWPEGKFKDRGNAPHLSEIAAGLQDPTLLKGKEWLAFVSNLLPDVYKVTGKVILAKLTEIGVDPDEARGIADKLSKGKTSWEAVEKHFDDLKRDEQRAWEKIARDNWGSAKSVGWRPEGWRQELETLDVAAITAAIEAARHDAIEAGIEEASAHLASLYAKRRAKESEITTLRSDLQTTGSQATAGRGPRLECVKCGHPHELCNPPGLITWKEPTKTEIAKAAARKTEMEEEITKAMAELQTIESEIEDANKPRERSAKSLEAEELALRLQGDLALYRQWQGAEAAARQARICKEAAEACGLNGMRRQSLQKGVTEWLNPMLAQWSPHLFFGDVPCCIDVERPTMPLMALGMPISRYTWGNDRSSTAIRCRWLLQIITALVDGSTIVVLDDGDVVVRTHLAGLMHLLHEIGLTGIIGVTRDDPAEAAAKMEKLEVAGNVHVILNNVAARFKDHPAW